MPLKILSNTFDKLTFLESFIYISIIPLILGIYAFYIEFYLEKNKEVLLLIGFGISRPDIPFCHTRDTVGIYSQTRLRIYRKDEISSSRKAIDSHNDSTVRLPRDIAFDNHRSQQCP